MFITVDMFITPTTRQTCEKRPVSARSGYPYAAPLERTDAPQANVDAPRVVVAHMGVGTPDRAGSPSRPSAEVLSVYRVTFFWAKWRV